MKKYISESCLIINNPFEKTIFIYDRKKHEKFEINLDAFNLLKQINEKNSITEKDFSLHEEFINDLTDYGILKNYYQKNKYNIKELKEYNNARIFVELTNKCNLKCKHCYGSFQNDKNDYIDFDTLTKVIYNAREAGVYQFDITGGEPLLYPRFEELLKLLYESGMLVRIFSNLTTLNKRLLDIITKYGVKNIVTSIDCEEAKRHDEFRGVEGSFDKTIKSIDLLKEKNIDISVNTMIGEHNKNSINELIPFLNSLEVENVLDVIIPAGRAVNLKNNIKESARIIRKIYDNNNEHINNEAISIRCGIGDRFIYIKPNGNIYLCPSLTSEKYKLGNINEYDTTKIWKFMQENFSYLTCSRKTEKCKKCNGGCRSRALLMHDDINEKDDVYCIINGVDK